MRIFVSHSHLDKPVVERIALRLRAEGHEVWIDTSELQPGDNLQLKIEEGIKTAEALLVVVSSNSFRSQWVQYEFSAMALGDVSKRERRIIPIKIDQSDVPSYLADRVYVDLSEDFDAGLDRLAEALRRFDSSIPATIPERTQSSVHGRSSHKANLREILRDGRLSLVCGAGVSVEAGVPAWGELLVRLLGRMMERLSKDHSMRIGPKAAAEFQQRHGSSSLILGKYLKNNLGRDFGNAMRDALYASNPTSSALMESIVRLARPQRAANALESIITFNFDGLIEEHLDASSIPHRPIFSEAISHGAHELPIYHVHGYLPRSGKLDKDVDLVFSEDAYHSQFLDPFSWSNLVQLNKLTQSTCLFVGISLTDPNMRRLLDVAWRKNPDKALSHYIIKKIPRFSGGDVLDEVAKLLEEQDANALGLNVVWFDDYREVPHFLDGVAETDDT